MERVLPIVTGVMVVLAIPFVFGSLRSVSIGQRTLYGTLVGMAFYIFNQLSTNLGLVQNFHTFVSAALPAAIFLAIAVYRIRKLY